MERTRAPRLSESEALGMTPMIVADFRYRIALRRRCPVRRQNRAARVRWRYRDLLGAGLIVVRREVAADHRRHAEYYPGNLPSRGGAGDSARQVPFTVTFTVEPFRYDAISSNDCCWGTSSSKSIDVMRPLAPNTLAVDGSMKFALASRAAFGKEKPRSITPLTTLNIVVTPQMPSASTRTASAQNDFSFDEDAESDSKIAQKGFGHQIN